MLRITDRALEVLDDLRDANEATEDEIVLLYPDDEGGLGLALAIPDETDTVIEHGGRVVAIVADELVDTLDGLVLDFDAATPDAGFVLGPQPA
jgi:hypothetical protein